MEDKKAVNITSIKHTHNVEISSEYANFLSHTDGISYLDSDKQITFDVDFLDSPLLCIDKIYGIDELREINSEFLDEIDVFLTCIIIAEDSGGNFYLLESVSGRILYWDRTYLHHALNDAHTVAIPQDLDEGMYQEEAIYYIFRSFNDIELLIHNT